jgi:flavorubredoxin
VKSRSDHITDSIIRISVAPAGDFSYNKFLILAEKPALIHTGRSQWFEETRSRVAEYIDPASLKVITFSHFEADECGALNQWLQLAPEAEIVHGRHSQATLEDFALKRPKTIRDGGWIDLGNKRLMLLETPHFPHNWDACLFYEPEEKVLFSSDVGAHVNFGTLFVGEESLEPIIKFQKRTSYMGGGQFLAQALNRLRSLEIEYLAIHHGATLKGKETILKLFDLLEKEFGETKAPVTS